MQFLNKSKFFDKIEYITHRDKEVFVLSNKKLGYSSEEESDIHSLFLKIINLNDSELDNLKDYIGPLIQVLSLDKSTYNEEIKVINKAKGYIDMIISSSFYNNEEVLNIACELNYFKTIVPQQYHAIDRLSKQIKEQAPPSYFYILKYICDFFRENEIINFRKYKISDFEDFIVASLMELLKSKKNTKKCENCGKYYIPGRSDAMYCKNPSPQNSNKTCAEYCINDNYQKKLSVDETKKLSRKISQRLQKDKERNRRPREIANFENFKKENGEWKSKVKKGVETKENYFKWLKEQDDKYTK